MVLKIVLVVTDEDEALPPVTAPLDTPEGDWLPEEPLPAGELVETEVRVSGHTVVDIGTTEVTMLLKPADGQSVAVAGQL